MRMANTSIEASEYSHAPFYGQSTIEQCLRLWAYLSLSEHGRRDREDKDVERKVIAKGLKNDHYSHTSAK